MIPAFCASYTLTRADALAWERRKRARSPREKLILFGLIALVGATYGAVEEDLPVWFLLLPRLVQFALLVAGFYGLWRLGLDLAARRRAARRLPAPLPCRFEDHGDHFRLERDGSISVIACESVWAVTATPRHVFIAAPAEVVILPQGVFPDLATAHALAEAWNARAVDLPGAAD